MNKRPDSAPVQIMSGLKGISTAFRFKLELLELDKPTKANWYTLYCANSAMGIDIWNLSPYLASHVLPSMYTLLHELITPYAVFP
jgi:hypothetical protein